MVLSRCAAMLAAGALALTSAGGALGVSAARARVSNVPASGTPTLAFSGKTEQIRQLVQCDGTIYAVGSFTRIEWKGTTYKRQNAFSFSARAPYQVTNWHPDVNGEVNTIGFSGSSCRTAYIGGIFTSVGKTRVKNLAALRTRTGAVDSRFRHRANAEIDTIASHGAHLLVGGFFTSINGSRTHAYMASLDPGTGAVGSFINLHISGSYSYCLRKRCAAANHTRIYNQQISHNGALDLVEGDFTSVEGKARQQIFMLHLRGRQAAVTGWTSPEFREHCWFDEPFYLHAASWSPNDKTVYVATTGFHPYDKSKSSFPLTGLCDAAAAFPASSKSVHQRWINYTGCDSLYATAAGSAMAYFAGHERWSQDAHGCNRQGPNAYPAPGMEGLYPHTGRLFLNQSGTAGYYSRARGLGADDMLLTGEGLWIASDNFENNGQCGGVRGDYGICFLPYSNG